MVERFNVISISLFKCACCHAYVVFCATCVACSDCGFVNYVFSHAFYKLSNYTICSIYMVSSTLWHFVNQNATVYIYIYIYIYLYIYIFNVLAHPITSFKCPKLINGVPHAG